MTADTWIRVCAVSLSLMLFCVSIYTYQRKRNYRRPR